MYSDLFSTKMLQTPPNMLLISLATSDFLFSAINGFPLMTISCFLRRWVFGDVCKKTRYHVNVCVLFFGDLNAIVEVTRHFFRAVCEIYAAIGGVCGFNSVWTLAVISYDRYFVIANPFEAMAKCTKSRALLMVITDRLYLILEIYLVQLQLCFTVNGVLLLQIMATWVWSAFLAILPFFGIGK